MSRTEITQIKKNTAERYGEVSNAFRGAMAVWMAVEQRYLPSLPKPDWAMSSDNREYWTRTSSVLGENSMSEIWGLANDDKVSYTDKVVLATTFDYVLVKKENIPKVIGAFKKFEGNTSLVEQAEILQKVYEDPNTVAVGWNQTSVCENFWDSGEYDEEKDEYISYNVETGTKHWFLFDELEK